MSIVPAIPVTTAADVSIIPERLASAMSDEGTAHVHRGHTQAHGGPLQGLTDYYTLPFLFHHRSWK